MQMTSLARRAVRHVASAVDSVKQPPAGVVILIYHRVGAGTSSRVDLPAAVFRDQMAELAESGRALSLADALEVLDGRRPSPHRNPVVVTFDDGTGDFVDHACPILAEHAIAATLYAATGWIDRNEPFWGDDTRPLSWTGLAEAVGTGLVSIGSHSHDHLLFDRISPAEADEQLGRSVGLIHENLGVDAVDFAYPKALAPSVENREVVARRFRSASVAGTRPNRVGAHDPYALWRTPVQTADTGPWFTRKLDGGLGFEDRLRGTLNRVRYRGSTR